MEGGSVRRMSDAALKTSPLHDRHVALGAKMADFGGWEMPIEYPGGGVVREHSAVRTRVGIFDVSHLGKARVSGPGAREFVNSCLANDLGRIHEGKAQYTLCCNESGGVVDDLIAYLRSDDDVFLIPNAANTGAGRRAARGRRARGAHGREPARGLRRHRGPGHQERRGARGARPAHRPRVHVLRRDRLERPPGHRLPHRLHGGARLRAGARVGGVRAAVGRPARGGGPVRRTALRPGRPRHAAHRDGLRPARQRAVPVDHARSRPASAGRSAGRRRRSGARTRSSPRRPPAPRGWPGACSPPVAAYLARTAR